MNAAHWPSLQLSVRPSLRWRPAATWTAAVLLAASAAMIAARWSSVSVAWFESSQAEHERIAVQSLQTIQQAETLYASTYPATGFACTLAELGGDPSAGAASSHAAQILKADLASGFESGDIFSVRCEDKTIKGGVVRNNGFAVTAVPQALGQSGMRGFCDNQFGSIEYDPAGGSECTEPVE